LRTINLCYWIEFETTAQKELSEHISARRTTISIILMVDETLEFELAAIKLQGPTFLEMFILPKEIYHHVLI